MKYQYFTLYDKQAASISVPFMCANEIEAKRIITLQLQNDKSGALKKYADCFDLYKLAEITDDAMKIHVPTDEERAMNNAEYRYLPDVGIRDVAPDAVVKVDLKFVCSVKSIVDVLEAVKEAANEEK